MKEYGVSFGIRQNPYSALTTYMTTVTARSKVSAIKKATAQYTAHSKALGTTQSPLLQCYERRPKQELDYEMD